MLCLDGFFPALPGFVRLANGEADLSESDNGEDAADSSESDDGGDGNIADAIALAAAASSVALPLTDFFPLPLGLGSANRATSVSSVSDDDAGKSAADEPAMASSAAAATAAGCATVQAAFLVERLRMGLSPTAGSIADSEGGPF